MGKDEGTHLAWLPDNLRLGTRCLKLVNRRSGILFVVGAAAADDLAVGSQACVEQ
jgi:hypothetical protein